MKYSLTKNQRIHENEAKNVVSELPIENQWRTI
jgi:hypothetical protein